MPFTPPPSSPIPLLDASLYDALGDLTPKAQLLAEARLTISFTAGKVVVEVAGGRRARWPGLRSLLGNFTRRCARSR